MFIIVLLACQRRLQQFVQRLNPIGVWVFVEAKSRFPETPAERLYLLGDVSVTTDYGGYL